MMSRLYTLRSLVLGTCLALTALLLPSTGFAAKVTSGSTSLATILSSSSSGATGTTTTSSTTKDTTIGVGDCTAMGGTWDSEANECNYGSKDPSTNQWKCLDGATWDESSKRCIPKGGWDPEKEKALCLLQNHTWDPSKPQGQQCTDSNGVVVDVYCDEETKEAIESAMKVHMEFGALQPHIDEIFNKSADCFKGAISIFDLSPSIPSLESIIGAVIKAVKDYVVAKICNVAAEIKKKITDPINDVITTINNLGKTGNISIANMSSTLFASNNGSKLLNSLSFAGAAKDRSGETLTINANGMNLAQRFFNSHECTPEQVLKDSNAALAELREAEDEMRDLEPLVEAYDQAFQACSAKWEQQVASSLPGQPYPSLEEFCKQEIADQAEINAQMEEAEAKAEKARKKLDAAKCDSESSTFYEVPPENGGDPPSGNDCKHPQQCIMLGYRYWCNPEGGASDKPASGGYCAFNEDECKGSPVFGLHETLNECNANWADAKDRTTTYSGGVVYGGNSVSGGTGSSGSTTGTGTGSTVKPAVGTGVNSVGEPCNAVDIMFGRCIYKSGSQKAENKSSTSSKSSWLQSLGGLLSGGNK